MGFEAADNCSHALVALVQEAAREIERLRSVLQTFDDAMRNGSLGRDAEKFEARAVKSAHKKAHKSLNPTEPAPKRAATSTDWSFYDASPETLD